MSPKRRRTIKTDVEKIKHLLINTDDKFVDIAKQFGRSPKTIQNINNGITHKKPGEEYPLRMSGQRLGSLRDRLATPLREAVPRPHVLSPQLLDYIGFLSILGADISCLLVFKEVFENELSDHFGRQLSDEDILAIVSIRPTLPQSLNDLVRAYTKPKVRLMNVDHWIRTGLIKESEQSFIAEMLLK